MTDHYRFSVEPGLAALANPALIDAVATAWARFYRASPIPAQHGDPLYEDSAMQQKKRVEIIASELNCTLAMLAYVNSQNRIIGFFWSMPVSALMNEKLQHVEAFLQASPDEVAYLSMLGVDPEHKGNRLGYRLTEALCRTLRDRGCRQAVARTINENALEGVYKPLGFRIYKSFPDETQKPVTIRHIFGRQLDASWPV